MPSFLLFELGAHELFAWLILSHDHPDHSLLNSWDDRCAPSCHTLFLVVKNELHFNKRS
jgi:hypothetical protein